MSTTTDIHQATKQYEDWLSSQLTLVTTDLELKHERMAADLFPFLRATFYRWMQLWPLVCPELNEAPQVLGVGDLHVENFGTWRDVEGRLVWGVNDFDEACRIPYTLDLVRLATSVRLAIHEAKLSIDFKEACDSLLKGYGEGHESRGCPFILAEEHKWLREAALSGLRDPVHFWEKMEALPSCSEIVPDIALKALVGALPEPAPPFRIVHRIAGLGSLGRQRYLAIGMWRGGKLAREVKALAPSASVWAQNKPNAPGIHYAEILNQSIRCLDPSVSQHEQWLVRRLAPDCSRIELASLSKEVDELRLLKSMGFETANIHLGSKVAVTAIPKDLQSRSKDWLVEAAKAMEKITTQDWEDWKKNYKKAG